MSAKTNKVAEVAEVAEVAKVAEVAPIANIFDPNMQIRRIVLVGLGGTGSHVARILARLCYDLRQKGIAIPQLLFIDGDKIEEKNVGRQMFTAAEVGCYKAETLARRFNFSLGLEISYRNQMLHKEWYQHRNRHDEEKVYYGDNETVWIGAVDSHVGRLELSQLRGLWIDAGNHKGSGQVVIGNSYDWETVISEDVTAQRLRNQTDRYRNQPQQPMRQFLPTAALIYPQLLEPEAAPTLSCADQIVRDEQALLVNDFMAAIVGQYLHKLLYRQPIMSFMTLIDIDGLAMRSIPVRDVMSYKQDNK